MPDHTSSSRVKGEDIIRGGDVHNSADNDGRDFQVLRIAGVENPCRSHLHDIAGVDFVQNAIATSGVIAVIGSPVLSDRLREEIFGVYTDISCAWRRGLLGRRTQSGTQQVQ